MVIKILWRILVFVAMLYATSAAAQGGGDILLRDLLWNMDRAQQSVKDMTFVFVTAAAKGSSIEKLNTAAQQAGSATLPEEARMSVWIKKPDKMKIVGGDYKIIIRKEGQEWFSYQYAYSTGRTARQKLPRDTWPVWPSQERIAANLKKYMAKNTPHTILRDDAAAGGATYVLTFKPKDTKEEYAYVIRIADWRILKSVFYENGNASFVAEWRDIEVNSALADKLFDLAESQAAPALSPGAQDTAAFSDVDSPEVLYAGVVKKEIV